MLGIFGLFGRSRETQRLDHALRAAGLHPRLVPDAVKITTLKLLKEQAGGAGAGPSGATPEECAVAAEMLAFCMLGRQGFAETNGPEATAAVETRMEAALRVGDSLDARLVLLALHAGVIQDQVVARYRLEAD